MIEDRIRWNRRYLEGRESPLHLTLLRFYHLAPKGKALDIACGTGENSIFLAKKGFEVHAFDISDVAVRKAQRKAKEEGVRVRFRVRPALRYTFRPETYSLVINFFFLERKIFPKIERSLKRGGLLIFETFNEDHRLVRRDFNPEYLLGRGELLRAFSRLEVLYYCEIANVTTLVARKP